VRRPVHGGAPACRAGTSPRGRRRGRRLAASAPRLRVGGPGAERFRPRNAAEIDRILTADGLLVVAAPGGAHLRELRQPLGLIGVDECKPQRLADAFGHYTPLGSQVLNYQLSLDHADLTAVTAMGPSAHHIAPGALADRIQALPSPAAVTVDLRISAYHRRG
jgi:23S rRNA (guanine745-N1)-methyltransferase